MSISREGLTFLESFFSTREYKLVQSLVLAPLRSDGQLYGVLLISIKEFGAVPIDLEALRSVVEKMEGPVYRYHTGRLSDLPEFSSRDDRADIVDRLRKEIVTSDRMQTRLLCATISVQPIIDLLVVKSVDVDTLRFREDFLRIFSSFVHETGFLTPLSASSVLFCLRTRHLSDPKFILDHMSATLGDFYNNIKDLPQFSENALYYPDNAATAEAICERLGVRVTNA